MSAAGAGTPKWSLRLRPADSSRLAVAFSISLILHAVVGGTYYAGKKLNWWQNLHWPAWLQSAKMLTQMLQVKPPPPPPPPTEPPLLFLDVSPAQAVTEAPKDARYYSDKNSLAANPAADKDELTPKIDGTQTEIVRTEDVPRTKFVPLQPSKPPTPEPQPDTPAKPIEPAKLAQENQAEQKPKAAAPPGDLAMLKPEPKPVPDPAPAKDPGEAPRPRPRTLVEARARQEVNRPPSEKIKQEGGVRHKLEIATLDAKATPFGAYDAAFIEAVRDRWFYLLDQRDYALESRGKVMIQFRLHYDGRITDMSVASTTTTEVLSLLCEKAVLDPAPFAAWPADMRRMLGEDRHIQFTFYYY
jgi:hypothetical protein